MLEFANPGFLTLLPLTAAFLVWWLRRRRPALRFSDIRLFADMPRGRARRAMIGGGILRFLALVALAIAVAGPRIPDLKTRIPTEGIAIVLVIDVSGSMDAPTFVWQPGSAPISRIDAAKRALRLFIAGGEGPNGTHFDGRSTERGTDAIGIVTFAIWPQPVCPPTLSHGVLLKILEDVQKRSVLDTGSNVGDAIAEGIIRLENAGPKRKVLILLSDGEHNFDLDDLDRKPLKPRQAAQLAANLGIKVYTIDTGGEPPADATADERKQRDDGKEVNRAVATITHGRSFSANDGNQLLDATREIDRLEREEILSPAYRKYRELYPWFSGLALGLWLSVLLLEQTRWRRIP